MKKRFVIVLIVVILGFTINRWAVRYISDQGDDDFNYFDSSHISGVIEKVGILHHMTGLKINNKSAEFCFAPIMDPKLNGNNDFESVANVGDSILKNPFSKLLVLKHLDRVYLYKFNKPS